MSEPLIVIGNGMAAARLVEELAKRALGRYAVAVIGDEPRLAYNRVLLSALLAEEVGFCDIELKPARWWRDRGHAVADDDERLAHRFPSKLQKVRAAAPGRAVLARREGGGSQSPSASMVTWRKPFQVACQPGRVS